MKFEVYETSRQAGEAAAGLCAEALNAAIREKGSARLLLSTGASQFPFFDAVVREDVDWSKVEMFHLDEYVDLPRTHKASFIKYLTEKFTSKVQLKKVHFVVGEGDIQKNIAELSAELAKAPVDVGMIGIGENAHIAFNDPPADFSCSAAYKVVKLDEKCRRQQVREGWFADIDDVCKEAISMSCPQIMKCRKIISLVPYAVKAQAVRDTLVCDVTPEVPATLLKTHADFTLICDKDSASLARKEREAAVSQS